MAKILFEGSSGAVLSGSLRPINRTPKARGSCYLAGRTNPVFSRKVRVKVAIAVLIIFLKIKGRQGSHDSKLGSPYNLKKKRIIKGGKKILHPLCIYSIPLIQRPEQGVT